VGAVRPHGGPSGVLAQPLLLKASHTLPQLLDVVCGHLKLSDLIQGQEFVIGGYTPSPKNFDALVFGYYEGSDLMYAVRTRNGFTPASREQLFRKFRGLEISRCTFGNLPEAHPGRWGQGLTADKMKECRWLCPQLVANFEFVEWTPDRHLRHSKFVGLREDRNPWEVRRES
jgi:bifunctional non-homologous end joining protein LigD